MKKIIVFLLVVSLFPLESLAITSARSSSVRSSVSRSSSIGRSSSTRSSSSRSSSTSKSSASKSYSSKSSTARPIYTSYTKKRKIEHYEDNYNSGLVTGALLTGVPMWLIMSNNNGTSDGANNKIDISNSLTFEHFPYIVVIDTKTKQYQVNRYIGENNKNEVCSQQEISNIKWFEEEIDEAINGDNLIIKEFFPYVLKINTITKEKKVYRYIGENEKELVSQQEIDSIEWLKEEFNNLN